MHRNQGFRAILISTLLFCLGASLSTSTQNDQTTYAQAEPLTAKPTMEWDTTFGLGHYNTAHQIIQTQDGGYLVTGMYGSAHPLNVTLVKLNPNGSLLWYKSYALQFINYPINTGLLQTNDSGYALIGNQYGTLKLTIIKIDEYGTIQWNQSYSNDVLAWGMTQTSDGGYLITGTTSYVTTGTHTQATIIKTDASGNIQWKKQFGAAYTYAVVQADDGNYVAAGGDRILKVDTSGNVVWDKELPPILPSDPQQYLYSANNILTFTKTSDGGYALAGHASNEKNGTINQTSAAILLKTDANGAIQWNKIYGEDRQAWVFSIVQTGDNGYALAGMRHTVPNYPLFSDFSQTDVSHQNRCKRK